MIFSILESESQSDTITYGIEKESPCKVLVELLLSYQEDHWLGWEIILEGVSVYLWLFQEERKQRVFYNLFDNAEVEDHSYQ